MTKAVGIARQSRGDEASKSIAEQEARIREHCKREGWTLTTIHPEQDVSGGTALDKRAGLRSAVEAIEAGKASVLVVAYFDRLVRSLAVQAEVLERVEAAGGRVLTLDVGEVSAATAGSWLSAGMLGMVAEYHRRTTSERVRAAHAAKRERGEWTGGKIPVGLVKDAHGKLTECPDTGSVVREAFARRDRGASYEDLRAYLREATGLEIRSLNIVTRMLTNESYVGLGVVDGTLFRRVGKLHAKRGPKPKSDRLLARLNVLHCATCNARMVVHGSKSQTQVYRCGGQSCRRKFSISCHLADEAVTHEVRVALTGREGRAGVNIEALQAEVDRRRSLFAHGVDSFSGLGDAEEIRAKLADLQAGIGQAEDALADAREAAGVTVQGGLAWDEMGNETRRDLIRAAVETAVVGPGVGVGRVRVTLAAAFAPEPALDRMANEVASIIRDAGAESRELDRQAV